MLELGIRFLMPSYEGEDPPDPPDPGETFNVLEGADTVVDGPDQVVEGGP